MKNYFTLLALFFILTVNANEYYKATIYFTSGQQKEGFAELPSNKTLDNAIKLRETQDGKSGRYDFDTIDKIIYYTDSGNEYVFERMSVTMLYGSKKKPKEHTYKKKVWFLLVFADPAINHYYTGQSYYIDNEDRIITKTSDSSSKGVEMILAFKRPDEENPTRITAFLYGTVADGEEARFRRTAALYFRDEPELVERIKNKEFKADNVKALAKAYVQYKK